MFDALHEEILNHARSVAPEEACGFIAAGEYHPCHNIHPDKVNCFRMDPSEFIRYNGNVQAIIHSHVNGPHYPSEADMVSQVNSRLPWGIACVGDGNEEVFFFGDQRKLEPLLARPFRHGSTDCAGLIRDFHKMEFETEMPEIPREWEWWLREEENQDFYNVMLEPCGFVKYDPRSTKPKRGDLVVFNIRSKVPNHGGILMGDGTMMHHLSGRSGYDPSHISRRENVMRWMDHATIFARHEKQL